MRKLIICAGLSFLTVSCAKVYHTTYNYSAKNEVGSLQVKLNKKMKNVSVSIDHRPIVKSKHTGKIVISNIPMGLHHVLVTASGPNRKDMRKRLRIVIQRNQMNTLSVKVPPRTVWSYVYEFGLPILGIVVSIIIADLSPNPNPFYY